ncbi:MAG: hypothetical protein M3O61_09715 [Gemmatimonadota bacterium]|nr:hypothetical protein [Gemmatimonadota bacterium]
MSSPISLHSTALTRRRMVGALTLAAIFGATATAGAQLRPLEPFSWRVFEDDVRIAADSRIARYQGQRASLAGTKGDLWEVPTMSFAWTSGRFTILASGTAVRFFAERERFGPPFPGVLPARNGRRYDSGEYTIGTGVRLTPLRHPIEALLRFGTRLPTTDNRTGLDRDATDFFATIVGHARRRSLSVSLEAGLGITATRDSTYEQDDLLLYSARVEYERGRVKPSLVVVGQAHGPTHRERRGVEDLSEARLGLRFGDRTWIRLEGVKGMETFSPAYGLSLAVGTLR